MYLDRGRIIKKIYYTDGPWAAVEVESDKGMVCRGFVWRSDISTRYEYKMESSVDW